MDIFRDRIRPLFDRTGLSDKEIAAELGIPVKLIYNWNNGVKSYNKYFDKIANYFHVSAEYLKGETDDKNPPPVGDGLSPALQELFDYLKNKPDEQVQQSIRVIKAMFGE